jgi:hypothetical protein
LICTGRCSSRQTSGPRADPRQSEFAKTVGRTGSERGQTICRPEIEQKASYGTLCAWAEHLRHIDALQLLKQNIEEEETTDGRLTELAESLANQRGNKVKIEMRERPGKGAKPFQASHLDQ